MSAPARGDSGRPARAAVRWRLLDVLAISILLGTAALARHGTPGPRCPARLLVHQHGAAAGLTAITVYGGKDTNKYLLETTGCGVAVLDIDGDGWLDLFIVNGSMLEGFAGGQAPTGHLYRNRRDGTFEDVTAKSGIVQTGWGQAACSADYDNDGDDDLFVTSWGQNHLYRNRGDGTFEDVTAAAGLQTKKPRWGAGCAFLDYDRDGHLDLFAANYIDFDLASAPVPESGLCRYKGIPVACGPPGLTGGKNVLYRNTGKGTFEDVSERTGITRSSGTYGLGVSTLDFNDDGWVDLYVANDSNPSALYLNNKDGTFKDVGVEAGCAYSQDGKPQAGMGVAVGDYDRNGTVDLFKTNFAGDTSTLYANGGKGFCEDRTFAAGHRPQHPLARMGRRLRRSRQRRLARPVHRQRPRLSRGRADQDRGGLQAAQGGLPQPRATAASRTSRSGSDRRSRRPPPAAARPSPISTTTATSTSSSTTSTRRRICSGWTRRRTRSG